MKVRVAVHRMPHGADLPLPSYETAQAAGMDLRAAVAGPVEIAPWQRTLVPTGLSITLPDGHEAQVRPRSGLALKSGVTVLNTPGTIDADYRGEIGVILINLSDEVFTVNRGDRIAQIVIMPVTHCVWQEVDALEASQRGTGGFGSTGVEA